VGGAGGEAEGKHREPLPVDATYNANADGGDR
jgi:hypothetical protein